MLRLSFLLAALAPFSSSSSSSSSSFVPSFTHDNTINLWALGDAPDSVECSAFGVTDQTSCSDASSGSVNCYYVDALCICVAFDQTFGYLLCPAPLIDASTLLCPNPSITAEECFDLCDDACKPAYGNIGFVPQGVQGPLGFPIPACSCECASEGVTSPPFTMCANITPIPPCSAESVVFSEESCTSYCDAALCAGNFNSTAFECQCGCADNQVSTVCSGRTESPTPSPSTSAPTPTTSNASLCTAGNFSPVGSYGCDGHCYELTGLTTLSGDSNTGVISAVEDAEGLFNIEISFNDKVTKIEYGGLAGNVLYAAAAATSNHIYDVLSESTFYCDEGGSGEVVGYVKSIRVPTPGSFRVCSLKCGKFDGYGDLPSESWV